MADVQSSLTTLTIPKVAPRGRDIGFAVGIVMILSVLFLPIPPFMIDLGLAGLIPRQPSIANSRRWSNGSAGKTRIDVIQQFAQCNQLLGERLIGHMEVSSSLKVKRRQLHAFHAFGTWGSTCDITSTSSRNSQPRCFQNALAAALSRRTIR